MTIGGYLPAAARSDRRWRNGGGVTREVAIFPADAGDDDFLWRASIAAINAPGPFSVWPGVDRNLMLLRGQLSLTVEGAGEHRLVAGDPELAFAGETAVTAAPIDGPCTVLNIMARRGAVRTRLGRWTEGRPSSASRILLLALGATAIDLYGQIVRLEEHDALSLGAGDAVALHSDRPLVAIEFFPDNRQSSSDSGAGG
ncbi:HutD/Ves family protein [Sphingopyxis panaciterrae]